MHNDTMEARLRAFENALDQPVPVGFQIVARLDGRSFTRLTKEICAFESPFDIRFRDLMATTCQHLMACGFNVLFAYSESDEISLLLHPAEAAFSRKPRKLISILAGEASAAFSVALGRAAAFDGRLSILPGAEQVVDYFRWRMADAARCCLNGHAYWLLRRQGQDAQQASSTLLRTSQSDKHDLLFANGINFDALPAWQKRGFGVYWAALEKSGRNLKTGEPTITQRRVLQLDFELPMGDTYACALQGLLTGGEFKSANPAENANIP
jgi:tRNA(His) 5'-end guanylyltransferase